MTRSFGVTISAVGVFIGSGLTILLGALMMLAGLVRVNPARASNLPPHAGAIVVVEAIIFFALSGWGIASGIGLLKTKEWARISIVVFSALLLLFSVPPALLMAFIRIPVPNDPNLPSNFGLVLHVGMSLFFGFFAALGGFWLYFFNRKSVKAQFRGTEAAFEAPMPTPFTQAPAVALRTGASARPLSITIIGWFLLVCSPFALLGPLYSRSMFPNVQMPMCFLGFFVFGRSATVILTAWMAAQAIAAVGLLKLRNWGRLGTIALQSLGILNIVLLVGIPTNRLRFQEMMDSMMASMNGGVPPPAPFVFPAWAMMVISLPIFFVILWFLFTRKQTFTSDAQQSIPLF